MSLTAYIRYDHTGRIVPGGPIVVKDKPANGNWQPVTEGTTVTLSGKLRAFVKVDRFGKPLAGSLFLGKTQPATGEWIEVNATYEGPVSPTTTTTTSTSTSTTTTTTTLNLVYSLLDLAYDLPNACANTGGNLNCGIPAGETLETTSVIYANFNGYLPPNSTYYFIGVNGTGVYTRTFLTDSTNTMATATSGVNYC